MTIRSADPLGEGFERRIRTQLARRVGRAAGLIERITVRFEDANGPKGGIDTVCRIKAVIRGRPSIVVEKRTRSHASAFADAATTLRTAVAREQGRHGLHAGPRPGASAPPRDRAHYGDTADRGTSASDRRAGDVFTARRNARARTTRATAALEDSRSRPSRKSTRRSANRGKPSQMKERAALARLSTPQARSGRRG